MTEQIRVEVDNTDSLKKLEDVAQAADTASQKLDLISLKPINVDAGDAVSQLNNVAEAADAAAGKIDQVSNKPVKVDTSYSVKQLQDMADSVNAFTQEIGKTIGKPVKLLNVADNAAELKKLIEDYQEVIRLSTTVRGPLNQSGQGPGNRPVTPMQIDQTLRQNSNYMQATLSRLMLHNANTSTKPVDVGLDYHELTGRIKPALDPNQNLNPKKRPAQNDSHFGQVAQRAIAGLNSAGPIGGMAAAAAKGAANASGLGAMGMLKGGGVAALAYGAFQAVSSAAGAVSDKMDAGKTENIEIDKFKRSLGMTSDSFDELKSKSRAVGEQFLLTYEQSRKLNMDFSMQARSSVNGAGLARVGIDLAQATGVDESQGTAYMATMRRSGNLGEKTQDAKIMAVQFAEALKRTGSTLNAGDLMQAMGGFASSTAQRSLGVANVDGFAGLLSALVGSKTPGLQGNVGNSANLLNRADSAFQGGGGMGEASNTLQFMAMEGDKVGLLGIKMRQAAGAFATGEDVFGKENGQVNKFLRKDGGRDMTRFGGQKSGLEQTLNMFDRQGVSKETQLLSASNHFKMNPEEMATLFNLREEGKLGGLQTMLGQYKDTVDPAKLSSAGLMAMADIQQAGLKTDNLTEVRDSMSAREGLTKEQKGDLDKAKSITDPKLLQDTLVKVANTFEREKTAGEQAQDSAAKTAQATARMAEGLLPLAQKSNDFLADLVTFFAPDSPSLKARKIEKEDALLQNANSENATSQQKQDASKLLSSRVYPHSEHIAGAEKKLGLESGELSGLFEHESGMRSDMFSKVVDPKTGKSTSAYGLGQMTTAAIKDATPEFKKMFGHDPHLEQKTSPTDGRSHSVPTIPWEQIYLSAIYKKQMNQKAGSVDGGNRFWFAGPGGQDGSDAASKQQIDAFAMDVGRRQEKYRTGVDLDLFGKSRQTPGEVSKKYGVGSLSPSAALPKVASLVSDTKSAPVPTPKLADKAPAALPKEDQKIRQDAIAKSSTSVSFNPARLDLSALFTLNNGAETQTQNFNRSVALKPQAIGVY